MRDRHPSARERPVRFRHLGLFKHQPSKLPVYRASNLQLSLKDIKKIHKVMILRRLPALAFVGPLKSVCRFKGHDELEASFED